MHVPSRKTMLHTRALKGKRGDRKHVQWNVLYSGTGDVHACDKTVSYKVYDRHKDNIKHRTFSIKHWFIMITCWVIARFVAKKNPSGSIACSNRVKVVGITKSVSRVGQGFNHHPAGRLLCNLSDGLSPNVDVWNVMMIMLMQISIITCMWSWYPDINFCTPGTQISKLMKIRSEILHTYKKL